jgi:hypothetical protein
MLRAILRCDGSPCKAVESFWQEFAAADETFTSHVEESGLARGSAWERVYQSPSCPRNPWRKSHTQRYWCWWREK